MLPDSTTEPMRAVQQHTNGIIHQALTLPSEDYADQRVCPSPGEETARNPEPMPLTLSKRARSAYTMLKGRINGGRISMTRPKLLELLGGVSASTLTRIGRELWPRGDVMRLFSLDVINKHCGSTVWEITVYKNIAHWRLPARPAHDHAALDRELAEMCEGIKTPGWHCTPLGICIPENGTLESELSDGKVLRFPTGEVFDKPAGWWHATSDAADVNSDVTDVTSDGGIKEEEVKRIKERRASRTLSSEAASIPADLELTPEWVAAAVELGVSREAVPREFTRLRDHALANGWRRADWFAAWRLWCGNYDPSRSPQRRAESSYMRTGRSVGDVTI